MHATTSLAASRVAELVRRFEARLDAQECDCLSVRVRYDGAKLVGIAGDHSSYRRVPFISTELLRRGYGLVLPADAEADEIPF